MWSCTRDEGRPLEVRSQVPASNPCKLRPSRAAVVSVAAKGGAEVPSGTIRRGERKRTADDVSKCQGDVKTGGSSILWDQFGAVLKAARATSGM